MTIHLSKENLGDIRTPHVTKPGAGIFSLPEKVLQFGTGVLLRRDAQCVPLSLYLPFFRRGDHARWREHC